MQKSKLYKKTIKAISKPKPMIEKKIKRGKESWSFIYIIFNILLTIMLGFISFMPLSWVWKMIIFIIIILVLIYLNLGSARFQKKIIWFKNKIENIWRKI
jgi:membrane protein insertase Oxa1/YidC/SpoIIIJ